MTALQTESVGSWGLVPDGSTFELAVVPASGSDEFAASARVVEADGSEEFWSDRKLHPGPHRRTLASADRALGIRVAVAFDSDAEIQAAVEAQMLAPDGSVHGTSYRHVVSGSRGDIRRATLVIFMA